MSSSITTYNGPRSAKERAALRWGLVELPAPEQARHERIIESLRRVEGRQEATAKTTVISRKWRDARADFLRQENARLARKIERIRRCRRR